jgi:hypothetical protein
VAASAFLATFTAMAGCMSIPLSTIWKLHEMTAERFFAHDPRALRVALRTDDAMKRGAGVPELRIDVDTTSPKPLCYAFTLDPIDVRATSDSPLDQSDPHRRWYAFRLSEKGVAAFDRAKREIRAKDRKDADVLLNVTLTDVLVPAKDAPSMPLRIDIALDRDDGYFTLINETVVDLAKAPAPAPKNVPDAKARPACVPAA